jgi:hypothetical protein
MMSWMASLLKMRLGLAVKIEAEQKIFPPLLQDIYFKANLPSYVAFSFEML